MESFIGTGLRNDGWDSPRRALCGPGGVIVLLLVVMLVMIAGCAKAPAGSTPATPQTPYQKAATVMLDFSTDLVSAQKVVVQLHTGGVIDEPTYRTVQAAFKQVADYGPQIDALISAQAASPTIVAKVNAALASLDSIVASTGQLDPNTAAQIKVAIQALGLLLQSLDTTFSSPIAQLEVNHGSIDYRSPGRAARLAWHSGLSADRGVERGGRNAGEAALRDPRSSRRQLCPGGSRFAAVAV
jgi:hypothetical protein